MSTLQTEEFNSLVSDILSSDIFKELDNELHHGVTRYGHSIRVAKATYKCAKKLNLDYKKATRAALLHDFFLNKDFTEETIKEKHSFHPELAVMNAKKYFNVDEVEENIIASHMFPLGKTKPKYKEAWLVTSMDKTVAAYEMYRFKFSLIINIWAIFIFNMITLQK